MGPVSYFDKEGHVEARRGVRSRVLPLGTDVQQRVRVPFALCRERFPDVLVRDRTHFPGADQLLCVL